MNSMQLCTKYLFFTLFFTLNIFSMEKMLDTVQSNSEKLDQAKAILFNLVNSKDSIVQDDLLEKYPELINVVNDFIDKDNNTALNIAIKNSNINVIKCLIYELKAKIFTKNKHGSTAIHFGAEYNTEALKILLDKCSHTDFFNLKNIYGGTIFHVAAQANIDSLTMLLDRFPKINFMDLKDIKGNTILHYAAQCNTPALHFLLDSYTNINLATLKDNDGITIFHVAAQYNASALKLLLDKYLHIDLTNMKNNNIFHLATKYNTESLKLLLDKFPNFQGLKLEKNRISAILHLATQDNSESLKLLLDKYSNINLTKLRDADGNTIFHLAASKNTDSLKLLLDKLSDINFAELKEKNGNTIFHLAAQHNTESLKLLVDKYSNINFINLKNKHGNTIYHIAAANPESLKILLDKFPDINFTDLKSDYGANIFHLAALYNTESLKILLDKFPAIKFTDLNYKKHTIFDFSAKNAESLKLLRDKFSTKIDSNLKNDNINKTNNNFNNPKQPQTDTEKLLSLISNKSIRYEDLTEVQKETVTQNINIALDESGNTISHLAIIAKNINLVKVLISDFDTDLILKNFKKENCFGLFISQMPKFVGCLASMTHSCANCKKEDCNKKCGNCQFFYYCSADCQKEHWRTHKLICPTINKLKQIDNITELEKAIIHLRVNDQILLASKLSKTRFVVRMYLNHCYNKLSDSGDTPLMYACKTSDLQLVKLLIENADVNAVNPKTGDSVLCTAIITGNYEIVAFLINKGANVNFIDNNGDTPLIKAIKRKDIELIQLLLKYDVDVTVENKAGKTALDISKYYGLSNIVDLLEKANSKNQK